MAKDFNYSDHHLCVAILHDILEDTEMTLGELRLIFGDFVANTVECLTHKKDESYSDYVRRVSKNPDAKIIKTFDVLCNLKESILTNKMNLVRKYEDALFVLING